MVPLWSSSAVVSTIAYMFSALLIVSSDITMNSSAENGGGVLSNLWNFHLEIKSGSSSLDIKNTLHDEIKDCNKGIDESITESLEDRNPIAERSINDPEKLDIDSKLNKLSIQFKAFEKLLQGLQRQEQRVEIRENVYLEGRQFLGVHCRTCNKTQGKDVHYPKNCKEVLQAGNKTSGIYYIFPSHAKQPFPALCDMETKGGGWTHIQKRFDGSQDFFLEWRNYKFGFGDLEGEFWLGLEQIYLLTDGAPSELLVEIVDRDNVSAYAYYTSFGIGPEKNGYTLDRLSGFSGDAGDSLTVHRGQKFSTKDLDFTQDNCATLYLGGWWYAACHISNLNGKFINVDLTTKLNYKGLHWKTFRSHEYCHSKSRMLVRPAS